MMTFTTIVFISNIALVATIVVIGASRFVHLLADEGLVNERTPVIGGIVRKKQEQEDRRIERVLLHLGIHVAERKVIRQAVSRTQHSQCSANHSIQDLSERLLKVLQTCTVQLKEGEKWGISQKNKHYVDSMGAMRHGGRNQLAGIMRDYLDLLIASGKIQPFQCVLANKVGNSLLAVNVCDAFGQLPNAPFPFLCKGEKDPSRIRSDQTMFVKTHILDFEGLNSFLVDKKTEYNASNLLYQAIILDDQCAGGGSICSIVRRFNELTKELSSIPFVPVKEVVVLFRIRDDNPNKDLADLTLHNMLYLDNHRMQKLHEANSQQIPDLAREFMRDFGASKEST